MAANRFICLPSPGVSRAADRAVMVRQEEQSVAADRRKARNIVRAARHHGRTEPGYGIT